MIKLYRINGKEFILNSDLIEYIEKTPDTVIFLVGGKSVMVKDSVEEVVNKVIEYKRSILTPKVK